MLGTLFLHDATLTFSLVLLTVSVIGFVALATVMFRTRPKVLVPVHVDSVIRLKRRNRWPKR